MAKVASCPNGHNYDSDVYDVCPYCPKNQSGENPAIGFDDESNMKTRMVGNLDQNEGWGNEKTHLQGADFNDAGKTVPVRGMASPANNQTFVPKGTIIVTPENKSRTSNRRLAGFLISFDVDPQGKSFKLYEGKNLIGSDPLCDIAVIHDPGISAKHLTVLYRGGLFRFKDEFSTNGTFINGKMTEEGNLNDKDIIEIGATRFCFMAIPNEIKSQK